MMRSLINKARRYCGIAYDLKPLIHSEVVAGVFGRKIESVPLKTSAESALSWLIEAFKAADRNGISAHYSISEGFSAAYPETTGYIIPTLFRYGEYFENQEAIEIGLKCSDWLLEIQNTDGSISAGLHGMNLKGCVFNTAMVLFGWLATWHRRPNDELSNAIMKACEFLLSSQDESGAFAYNLSQFAESTQYHSYNVRAAWALIAVGKQFDRQDFIEAGRNNVVWSLEQRNSNGMFLHLDMAGQKEALTHPLAYTLRGILEAGILLNNAAYIETVRECLIKITALQRPTGGFSGVINSNWTSGAKWECLTGTIQFGIIMQRYHHHTKMNAFCESLDLIIKWAQSNQILNSRNKRVYGGLFGSYPIYGRYLPYTIPNWGVKFVLDLILNQLNAPLKDPS